MEWLLQILAKAMLSIVALLLAAWALQFHRSRCPTCRRRGLKRLDDGRFRCDHCGATLFRRHGRWENPDS